MAAAGGTKIRPGGVLRAVARLVLLVAFGFGAGVLIGVISEEPELLVEAMAQTLAYWGIVELKAKNVYLATIERARFRRPVEPGQTVQFVVRPSGQRMGVFSGFAEARVDDVKVAEAQLRGVIEL